MKKIIILITLLTCLNSYSQNFTLLEINAKWNKHNNLPVNKIANIKIQFAWLEDQPASIQRNVISVPTLILMNNGKSIAQWRAGIDLNLKVTEEEVIKAIEIFNKRKKIIMTDYKKKSTFKKILIWLISKWNSFLYLLMFKNYD